MDLEQIKSVISENGIETIILAGTDPTGVLRGKRFSSEAFLRSAGHGIHLASFIFYTTTVDDPVPWLFDTGIPDCTGLPDLATFRIAPWEENAAICLVDWYQDGEPSPFCPRLELKRQVAKCRELGWTERFAMEMEFFLIDRDIREFRQGDWGMPSLASQDIHCYSIYEGSFWEPLVKRLRQSFPDEVESCLPEWGSGQFEINLRHSDAISMADTTVLFKLAIKQLAAQSGISTTFMAKIHEAQSGNSGHIHQSLWDANTEESLFFDPSANDGMTALFRHFTAGQLDVFRSGTLFLAPFVNSYKRFQLDSFAGVKRTWGYNNRTVSLRAIADSSDSARLEHRVGGADLNPYTAFAFLLGAGVRGIQQELDPGAAHGGNAYNADVETVPFSLREAVEATEAAPVLKEIINPTMVENLIRLAKFESGVFDQTVTELERRRYFEMA
ncbi:MAG: glutamine synthetase family protein [Pseudomonadota bacterium]